MFIACLILSLLTLAYFGFHAYALHKFYRSGRLWTASRVLAVGVFLAIFWIFLPHCLFIETQTAPFLSRALKSVFLSLYHAIRFFVADGDLSEMLDTSAYTGIEFFSTYGSFLLVFAPLMTCTVILSFFQNLPAYWNLLTHPNMPIYIFSELNDKSLALATDIRSQKRPATILFADVFNSDSEEDYERTERAKELKALCFKNDILKLERNFASSKRDIYFFLIAQEKNAGGIHSFSASTSAAEEENVKQAYRLATGSALCSARHKRREVFVFAKGTLCNLMFSSFSNTQMTVSAVDLPHKELMGLFLERGKELFFDTAVKENGEKQIRVAIVGATEYGVELLKKLVWLCQIEGYKLFIDLFDQDPLLKDRFAAMCPGLIQNNDIYVEGEMYFCLRFHGGISFDTDIFQQEMAKIPTPTYILVARGEDEATARTAIALRRLFRRLHATHDPYIQAVIYDSDNRHILENAKGPLGGDGFSIDCIGDLKSVYTMSAIQNKDLEEAALQIHARYTATIDSEELRKSFTHDLYQKDASEALVVSQAVQRKLGILSNNWENCTPEERDLFEKNEHRRWCAFMHSVGWVYSDSHDKHSRDNLALMHHNLLNLSSLKQEQ